MNSAIKMLDVSADVRGDKLAFQDIDSELTFAQLQSTSKSIGTVIAGCISADTLTPVVVMLPKSVIAAATMLGVLYSGNCYVPVDYRVPTARLEAIVDVLGACKIITDEAGQERLAGTGLDLLLIDDMVTAEINEDVIELRLRKTVESDPAYIMFTSGSTGTPKGVAVPHRAIIDYADWVVDTFDYGEDEILGNQAAFYFANSIFDIYTSLKCGATMHIIPEVLFTFPSKLPAYLAEQKITSIFWVPTVMKNVANSNVLNTVKMPDLKTIAFCGEILSATYMNAWRENNPQAAFANLYGMTEAADACCYYFVERDFCDSEPLPIGQACENMRVLVLREDDTEAAPNEIGEICVIGAGLALGYWNSPDLSEKAFSVNPLESRYKEKMYRTGDLGFKGQDGLYYVKGRKDSQVKVKGNRIELGEVECAAAVLPEAHNVCVLFDAEKEEIVLFVQTEKELQLRKVNKFLKALLPDYMLPARLIAYEQFPLTASGKIDRMKLRKEHKLV